MQIRFAQIQDIPGILSLLRQDGLIHHKGRPDIFRPNAQKYGASQVISMLNKPGTPIFVAVEDQEILGYCFCAVKEHKLDPVIADRTELYIDDLCVDEAHRGKGIGKALYETACRYARQRSCGSITLNVWSCNAAAIKFYESCGLSPRKLEMEHILEEA